MSEENRIDYTDVLTAVRKGDEEAYEFLYNESVRTCRARCMKYFDPAAEAGRRKTDLAVRDIYVRLYDGVMRLSDPEDFPLLARRQTREVCERMLEEDTVLLSAETYIDVAGGAATDDEPELVTAEACRAEVKEKSVMSEESISALVLAVLHRLTPAQRLSLILWNGNDDRAFRDPATLRDAFIKVEQSVMELEQLHSLRAKDFAQSRLAFFNWLLDLYDRFCQSSTKDWNGAEEPALALALDPDAQAAEANASPDAETSFRDIWDDIRSAFYIRNTMELPGGLKELLAAEEAASTDDDFTVYLDGEDRESAEPRPAQSAPKAKRGLLSTRWGRLLIGLLIVLVVLALVIATAGQHTSHALAEAETGNMLFMQIADFVF